MNIGIAKPGPQIVYLFNNNLTNMGIPPKRPLMNKLIRRYFKKRANQK